MTNLNYAQWIDDIRRQREQTHAGITDVFNRMWEVQKHDFDHWYELERVDYQRHLLQHYINDQTERSKIMRGEEPITLEAMLPSEAELTVQVVEHVMRQEARTNAEERLK